MCGLPAIEPRLKYTSGSSLPAHQSGSGALAAALLQPRGHHGVQRRLAHAVAVGVGGQPERRAQVVDRRRGQRDRPLLQRREPEPDAHDRDVVQLADERRAVLPRLAHDQVRPPRPAQRAQPGQHRLGVEAREVLGEHPVVGRVDPQRDELRLQRAERLGRRVLDERVRQPRARHVALVLALRRDQHLVARALRRVRERRQREQMPSAATAGEEDSHPRNGTTTEPSANYG
jgi:hypothetical protein